MESTELNSKALRQAALRSDRIRIIAILIVLCLLFVFTVARRLLLEGIDAAPGLAIFASFFAAMIAYEAATLRRVTRALAEGTEPDPARWISNVVVEALFPTIGLGMLIAMGMARPYAALVAPIVLTYFLFISLSTLRLSPTLARLSGLCSAAGYSAAAIYVFARYPTPDLGADMYPIEFPVGNVIVILVAGFVAGEVARQIRGHVSAALREAREAERVRGELKPRAPSSRRCCRERHCGSPATTWPAGISRRTRPAAIFSGGRAFPTDASRSRSRTSLDTASARPSWRRRVMLTLAPAWPSSQIWARFWAR